MNSLLEQPETREGALFREKYFEKHNLEKYFEKHNLVQQLS